MQKIVVIQKWMSPRGKELQAALGSTAGGSLSIHKFRGFAAPSR